MNLNLIHYCCSYKDNESKGNVGPDYKGGHCALPFGVNTGMRSNSKSKAKSKAPLSIARVLPTAQPAPVYALPAKVAALTRTVIDLFLKVNKGWINTIDPVTTHQKSCVLNGQWNAGTCTLVV